MSIETVTFVSERTISPEDFVEWVAKRRDDHRYELLGGRIVMTPPSVWPEGEGELRIGALLERFVRERGLGRTFGPSQSFELPTGDVVAPDLSYISHARWDAGPRPVPGQLLRIVPNLVVEITTPDGATRDRLEKRRIYASAGAQEYWIVDLRRREATVFLIAAEGRFDDGRTLGEADTLASTVLSGLSTAVRDLLIS